MNIKSFFGAQKPKGASPPKPKLDAADMEIMDSDDEADGKKGPDGGGKKEPER